MSRSIHKLGVYIGRFAPFHIGHEAVLECAKQNSHKVLVLVGSATQSRNLRTPFTAEERKKLIPAAHIDFLRDYPYPFKNEKWIQQVKDKVRYWMTSFGWSEKNTEVTIFGASRDLSCEYLNFFPNWNKHLMPVGGRLDNLSASIIRDLYFGGTYDDCPVSDAGAEMLLRAFVPVTTYQFLKSWQGSKWYTEFYESLSKAKELECIYGKGPHIATDSIVLHGSEILVVVRKNIPGKGLWALPGGYLEPNISLLDNARKEVFEETSVNVWEIEPSVHRIFDAPHRAGRGRIVSVTYMFDLKDKQAARGGDDADDAYWVPLKGALESPEAFHDDHFHIIEEMTSGRV